MVGKGGIRNQGESVTTYCHYQRTFTMESFRGEEINTF